MSCVYRKRIDKTGKLAQLSLYVISVRRIDDVSKRDQETANRDSGILVVTTTKFGTLSLTYCRQKNPKRRIKF